MLLKVAIWLEHHSLLLSSENPIFRLSCDAKLFFIPPFEFGGKRKKMDKFFFYFLKWFFNEFYETSYISKKPY